MTTTAENMNLVVGVEQMQEMIEQLPLTADGVRFVPNKNVVWYPYGITATPAFGVYWSEARKMWRARVEVHSMTVGVADCYSTKELALRRLHQ